MDTDTEDSTEKNEINVTLIGWFWNEMAGVFGNTWHLKYGKHDSGAWIRSFTTNRFARADVQIGIDMLLTPQWSNDEPPTPGKFAKMVIDSRKKAYHRDAVPHDRPGLSHPTIAALAIDCMRGNITHDDFMMVRESMHAKLVAEGEIDPITHNLIPDA